MKFTAAWSDWDPGLGTEQIEKMLEKYMGPICEIETFVETPGRDVISVVILGKKEPYGGFLVDISRKCVVVDFGDPHADPFPLAVTIAKGFFELLTEHIADTRMSLLDRFKDATAQFDITNPLDRLEAERRGGDLS